MRLVITNKDLHDSHRYLLIIINVMLVQCTLFPPYFLIRLSIYYLQHNILNCYLVYTYSILNVLIPFFNL